MRIRTMTAVLLQVASLAACDGATRANRSPVTRSHAAAGGANEAKQSADAIAVGAVGERERPASAPAPASEELWFRPTTADPMDRLILRTGQASIEVDSLETAMARLRQLARRAGGFVADAAVQSGRDQVRQATLELKVPSARFDELTEGLEPIGRLEFVNVSAEDVSEEFVDLAARAANGRRLEERLVELLRTRTGKLQDVLSVERELARVREEIERIEGRLRYLKTSAAAQHALGEPARADAHRRDPGARSDRRGVPGGMAQLRGGARGVDRVPRLSGADRRARLGPGRVRAKVAATGDGVGGKSERGKGSGARPASLFTFPFSRCTVRRPNHPSPMPVDILAIAAHRDDVELTCAGTLLKAVDAGYRAAILDLTAGESGTRGSADLRADEAKRAAEILGVTERRNAGLPDARLHNSEETRRIVVAEIRHFAPRVVILPFPVGRHPDHRVASELGRDACFLAGLARYDAPGTPHRPHKILYALSYREDPLKPTFVVDISDQFARKLDAIRCYASQFDGAKAAGEIFPTGQDLYSLVETQNAHYGSLIRSRYGEPFYTHETLAVEDVVALAVQSM